MLTCFIVKWGKGCHFQLAQTFIKYVVVFFSLLSLTSQTRSIVRKNVMNEWKRIHTVINRAKNVVMLSRQSMQFNKTHLL